MTNYKEILRLQSLGINNTRIAEACGCARSTVISTLQYAGARKRWRRGCYLQSRRGRLTKCPITSMSTVKCRKAA